MHAFSSFSSRALMLIGLGLILAMSTGCNGEDVECEVAEDCGDDEFCSEEGVCEPTEIEEDLCEDVTCPGGMTCDPDTGECVGECCEPHTCLDYPGAECDEDLCRAQEDDPSVNPCVQPTCDPPCEDGYVCNEDTLECEVECMHYGCPEVYERCNPDTGACEMREPQQGEIGWPCDSDDPGSHAECDDICGVWDFCTTSCREHGDCPAGSFCLDGLYQDGSGYCFAACEEFWGEDCARGMQCVEFSDLDYPACYPYFPISDCEEDDCVPRGEQCDPRLPDQCEADLACVDVFDDRWGVCQEVQCALPYGGCQGEGEICVSIGANMSICADHCDVTEIGGCPEGLTCQPERKIDFYLDKWSLAASAEACPPEFDSHIELVFEDGTEYLCYEECEPGNPDSCPVGQFCVEEAIFTGADPITACVNYHGVMGDADACDQFGEGMSATEFEGYNESVCYLGCETDADCDEGILGSCSRLTFQSGEYMDICLYGAQGAMCLFGCESHGECGYCESDDDCPTFRDSAGSSIRERCDFVSQTCRRPTTELQFAERCYEDEAYDPEGITDEDGDTRGACAYECESDDECVGECGDNGFCIPVPQTCNYVSGQCEYLCDEAEDCLHEACIEGFCQVGCEDDAHCGDDALCYFPEEEQSYCIFPECEQDEDCGEGWVCDDGVCYPEDEPECTHDDECEGTWTCDVDAGVCIPECIDDDDCEGTWTCDVAEGVCIPECVGDEDCAGTWTCDVEEGACIEVKISDVRNPDLRDELGDGPYTVEGIVAHFEDGDLWIQAENAGPWDGIMVWDVTTDAEPGDVVLVTGDYGQWHGMDQLQDADVTVIETGGPVPEPLLVDSDLIATGSEDAFEYQALLLEVQDVEVTEFPIADDGASWDGDFRVTGGLVIGTRFDHTYDDPTVGDEFDSIMGLLRYTWDEYRLEPRSDDDLEF